MNRPEERMLAGMCIRQLEVTLDLAYLPAIGWLEGTRGKTLNLQSQVSG